MYLHFIGRHLGFFPLPVWLYGIPISYIGFLGPNNFGVTAGTFPLACMAAKIHGFICRFCVKHCNFRFCDGHIELLGYDKLDQNQMMPFHSPAIFWKSHKRSPLNSKRFRSGSEKIGPTWGNSAHKF